MSFSGKVVLISGGASGIGAASAELFIKEGASVVITDKNGEGLSRTAELCNPDGKYILGITANLADDDDAKRIVNETIERFGKLDVLVNCAGVLTYGSLLDGNLIKSYDELMPVNLRSVMNMCSLCAPYLIATKGNIVNIASVGAYHTPSVEYLAYCASKAAVLHFTRGAAKELGPHGVRVNCISPGAVRTDIVVNSGRENCWEDWAAATALKRTLEPIEIAELVCYLASDKARGMTGSDIVNDNGQILN